VRVARTAPIAAVSQYRVIRRLRCPGQRSQFEANGIVTPRPAPSPLEHFAVSIDTGGNIIIHTGQAVPASARMPREGRPRSIPGTFASAGSPAWGSAVGPSASATFPRRERRVGPGVHYRQRPACPNDRLSNCAARLLLIGASAPGSTPIDLEKDGSSVSAKIPWSNAYPR
jgi:hypothetical protein